MSDATTTVTSEVDAADHHDDGHAHPPSDPTHHPDGAGSAGADHASDHLYIKIAVGLAVLTGMEVAWPYLVDDGPILMFPLLIVMAIKFVIIAAFFMHLKFDSKVLTRVFYSGLVLAVGVYVITLLTFRLFEGGV